MTNRQHLAEAIKTIPDDEESSDATLTLNSPGVYGSRSRCERLLEAIGYIEERLGDKVTRDNIIGVHDHKGTLTVDYLDGHTDQNFRDACRESWERCNELGMNVEFAHVSEAGSVKHLTK